MSLARNDILLSCVVITLVLVGVFYPHVSEAANVLFTILVQHGSLTVTGQNSTFHLLGLNGIVTSANDSTILINSTRIISSGMLTRVEYQGCQGVQFLTDQMAIKGSYNTDVRSTEPFNGTITFTTVVPIFNTFTQPIIMSLFINDINTTQTLQINPHQTTPLILFLNHHFNQFDQVYWTVTSNDHSCDEMFINARVLINYIS